MAVQRAKLLDFVLNASYYLFVILLIPLVVVSMTNFENKLLVIANIILLAFFSLILVLYIAVQVLRHNIITEKKSQLGVLLIILGFVLIISTILQPTINYDISNYFPYFGLGAVILGTIVELLMLDEAIWIIIVRTFKHLANLLQELFTTLANFLKRYYKKIILYSADVASIIGIVIIGIYFPSEPLTEWWKLLILAACSIYLLIHHRIAFYELLKFIIVTLIWDVIIGVTWEILVDIAKFIKDHWQRVLEEFIRLAISITAIILMLANYIYEWHIQLIYILGPITVFLAEILLRKYVLLFLYNFIIELINFVRDIFRFILDQIRLLKQIIIDMFKLIKDLALAIYRNIKTIFIELLRASTVGISIYLLWAILEGPLVSITGPLRALIIASIVILPLFGELFTRKVVLIKIRENLDIITRATGALTVTVIIRFRLYESPWPRWTEWLFIPSAILLVFGEKLFMPKVLLKHLRKNYIAYSRFFALLIGIYGAVYLYISPGNPLYLSMVVVGFTLFVFADPLLKPRKLWEFIKRIPKFIRYLAEFTYHNIIELFLFSFAIFTLVYSISLLSGRDLLSIFGSLALSVRISVGIGFLTLSAASFILFVNEVKRKVKKKVEKGFRSFVRRLLL